MTRDVYAGDQGAATELEVDPTRVSRISIRAEAQPDVLLRIAAALNLFNVAPHELHLRRESKRCDSEDIVQVEVGVRHCSTAAIDMVCRKLAQLTCVLEVSSGADG